MKTGTLIQRGRGVKGRNYRTTLQQWLVRKHGKLKAGQSSNKGKKLFHNTPVTNTPFDKRINKRRQYKRKQQLTIRENKALHEDVADYGQQFDQGTDTQDTNKVRVHSHNINNMPQYATDIKDRSVISELKWKTADIYLWQEIRVCWPKVKHEIIGGLEQRDLAFIQT